MIVKIGLKKCIFSLDFLEFFLLIKAVKKFPAKRDGPIIKSQHLITRELCSRTCITSLSPPVADLVEVKSVQAGTHRVEHGSL